MFLEEKRRSRVGPVVPRLWTFGPFHLYGNLFLLAIKRERIYMKRLCVIPQKIRVDIPADDVTWSLISIHMCVPSGLIIVALSISLSRLRVGVVVERPDDKNMKSMGE